MVFRLIHRTDHRGLYIHASENDPEVPYPVIWTQAVWKGNGCCQGFGPNCVDVIDRDLSSALFDKTEWFLYLVSETVLVTRRGITHRFLKFVLSRRRRQPEQIEWPCSGEPLTSLTEIRVKLTNIFRKIAEAHLFFHFHVGIEMPRLLTGFDTVEAEEEYDEEISEWWAVEAAIDAAIVANAEPQCYEWSALEAALDAVIEAEAEAQY